MSPFNLQTCARPNILELQPYRCARDDYKDDGTNILLDANENAYGPSISVADAKALGGSTGISGPELDLLGLHSDEAIDALLRCFCVPGCDRILVCPPTYGMYSVSAQVNDIDLVKVPLLPAPGFGVDVDAVLTALTASASSPEASQIKLVYLCSPGNPTGAALAKADVERVLRHPAWNGVVVLDEAYVDFQPDGASLAEWVLEWPNLVVMQTMSKAFGMAGIRLGAAFASEPIARLLNSMKAPYNIPSPTSALAMHAVSPAGLAAMRRNRDAIVRQRDRLVRELPLIDGVGRLRGGVESNFLLYEMLNARGEPDNVVALAVYEKLAEAKGVVVRFRGKEHDCLGCLRITVGTAEEVTRFLDALTRTLAEVRGTATAADDEAKKEEAASSVVS
ncbi:hypothetical protein RB595_006410 [Gaeumannomyces hyphopodioides]